MNGVQATKSLNKPIIATFYKVINAQHVGYLSESATETVNVVLTGTTISAEFIS